MSDPVPKIHVPNEGANRLPAKIGRYEVVEKLGSGSTGTVYKATDPFIGRVLAIKTFRVDLLPGPQRDRYLQRFYHEARISGGLSHPNIVALFDVGEMDGLPYLVFEFVEGPSLDVALARTGRLDSSETIRVVEQAAAALDFAHARGIVHRDVRPANIILATDRRVRIADFGIARIEGSHLTQLGEVLGTPAYMSPEQIRGQELSPGSDLFSLAVCAYEMLSGERPFEGKNQAELLEALVYSPPAEPKELRALGIPSREFMFVFERALAKDPAHRFADGAAFARALKSCLGVVAQSESPVPVRRIAVPVPETAPEPEPPPVAKPVPPPPIALVEPAPPKVDTAATAVIEGGSGGPLVEPGPKFISSSDATLGSTAKTEPGVRRAPSEMSAEATLVSAVGFEHALKAEKPGASADATLVSSPGDAADSTMVSPLEEDELPPTQRLSRSAVESLLARSSAGAAEGAHASPSPLLQKTQPGSEVAPASSSDSAIEGLLPPTREMTRLPASPPLQPSARETAVSKPGFTLEDVMRSAAKHSTPGSSSPPRSPAPSSSKDAEQTVIMTDSERAAAAKIRAPERSAAKVQAPPPPPKPVSIPPSPSKAVTTKQQPLAPPPLPPASARAKAALLPRLLAAGIALLALLGLAVGAVFWGSGHTGAEVEKWNELPVSKESEVDKTPFLLSSQDFPKMKLEPGVVVSVTLSWIVTTEGLVDDPKIVASATPEIDAVVMETVRKWRYEPGVKETKTVPVRVLRKYTFPQGGGS